MAGLLGMECDQLKIPRPQWTRPEPLPDEWVVDEWVVTASKNPTAAWIARIKARTPDELAHLNLWVHRRDLERA
jgi:hypothetical protein